MNITHYDVTNTADLVAHGTGQRIAHRDVAMRTDARRHAADVRGFDAHHYRQEPRARREGPMPEHRRRPDNGRTRVQRPKTAQQAHEELSIGGVAVFPGWDKDAEGPAPYPPPSAGASSIISMPLQILTVRVARPGRRSTIVPMTAKVTVEQRAASSPTSMRSVRGSGAAQAWRAAGSSADASS